MVAGMLAICLGVVTTATRLGHATLLEIAPQFWIWDLITSAVVGVTMLLIGWAARPSEEERAKREKRDGGREAEHLARERPRLP